MNKDMVEHPAHYTHGGIECIDAIEAALGRDGFIAFLRGQVIRYQWRLGHKDSAVQDAAKARWYAVKLEEVLKSGGGADKVDDGGWIEHDGGECPVDRGAKVDLRLRNKNELFGFYAGAIRWSHDFGGIDIVSYRLSKK